MDDLDVLVRDFGKSPPLRSTSDDRDPSIFSDVFGGPPKYTTATSSARSSSLNDFDYDSMFKSAPSNSNDDDDDAGPVYDDDVVRGKSVSEENVFASIIGDSKKEGFDDLLGGLGGMDEFFGRNQKSMPVEEVKSSSGSGDFHDLLGDFHVSNRSTNVSPHPLKQSSPLDDPFVVLDSTSPVSSASEVSMDPLKDMSNPGKPGNTKGNTASMSGGPFDDLYPLNGFNKPVPAFSPDKKVREKDRSPSKPDTSSFRYFETHSQKKVPGDSSQESPLFDIPSVSTDPRKSFGKIVSSPPRYSDASYNEKSFRADVSPRSEELPKSSSDIWLSVSEIQLFTQPTKAPPPSRLPPPIPQRTSKAETGYVSSSTRRKGDDYSSSYSSYSDSSKPRHPEVNKSSASQIDDLENFARGRSQNNIHNDANIHSGEDMDAAAAAMKEAMDRAEAKFRHAKEVREREDAKAARSKESFQAEKDEQTMQEAHEREYRENQERLEVERRQKEKEEGEQRRLEKERAERERARQAVQRATREARERAGVDARDRAAAEARLKAERAAVAKAQAEARERAGKAAVQRVQAEARERAAAEAKERAEKAAAEAREKSNAEAREREAKEKAEVLRRSQRAAVERAAAEARERAAVDARDRATTAARATQQKNENDLESFFSSRPNSAPKARTSSSDPFFDQFHNGGGFDAAKRTPPTSGPASNLKKASSATNIVDDLSSIFGAPTPSRNFQDVEGETEERRRSRLERHQRTQERAAKALAEKNQRDLNVQREQEERERIGETLDFEIKRWAAGKEGNLRALLSTLQYVLWPECGWQPVSLTDLITGANVKKFYRKSTLCIHPDKVQQKGATLQQKYIAEKVFDLLKEAWNKFNSEELF